MSKRWLHYEWQWYWWYLNIIVWASGSFRSLSKAAWLYWSHHVKEMIALWVHGWKLKILKILNFENSTLKTCSIPTKYSQFHVKMIKCPLKDWKSIREAIMISLIQHFEADYLWKVSLKILKSGIILKTFTHVSDNNMEDDRLDNINLLDLLEACSKHPDDLEVMVLVPWDDCTLTIKYLKLW